MRAKMQQRRNTDDSHQLDFGCHRHGTSENKGILDSIQTTQWEGMFLMLLRLLAQMNHHEDKAQSPNQKGPAAAMILSGQDSGRVSVP